MNTTSTAAGDAEGSGPESLAAEASTSGPLLPGAADPAESAPGESADQERWVALTQRLLHLTIEHGNQLARQFT